MSHAATNWAIQQRGLKPAVNRHLDTLEALGLIRRVQRINPKTRKQENTAYELGFDHDISVLQNETRPASQNDTRSVSQKPEIPCLNSGDSRVSNCDTNPVKEPVREPCGSEADPHSFEFSDEFFDRFMVVYPRPGDHEKTKDALIEAIASGVDPAYLLSSVKAYAREQKGNEARYIAFSENWLARRGWEKFAKPSGPIDDATRLQSWADRIKAGEKWLVSHVNSKMVADLLRLELVTRAELIAVGFKL